MNRWWEHAQCRGADPSLFFPPNVAHGGPQTRWTPPAEALALCAACPVRGECAEEGRGEYGLWGGTFRSERESRVYRGLDEKVQEFENDVAEIEGEFAVL